MMRPTLSHCSISITSRTHEPEGAPGGDALPARLHVSARTWTVLRSRNGSTTESRRGHACRWTSQQRVDDRERWDFARLSRKDPTLNLLGPVIAIELAIRHQIYCIYHHASDSVVVASSASQHRASPVAAPYVGVTLD